MLRFLYSFKYSRILSWDAVKLLKYSLILLRLIKSLISLELILSLNIEIISSEY